jgi:hypothetical protein
MNTYRTTLRPASVTTLPPGVKWEFLEAPWDLAHIRTDLPRSAHRYGVFLTDRRLTDEEREHFDLVPA